MIAIDEIGGWKRIELNGFRVFYASNRTFEKVLLEFIKLSDVISKESIVSWLSTIVPSNFAFVIESDLHLYAVVDHIRSYPLFYKKGPTSALSISNFPRNIAGELGQSSIDISSLSEFTRAGFVTGNKTVVKDVFQLLPGEILSFTKECKSISLSRYYKYLQTGEKDQRREQLIDELDSVIDRVFKRVITEANGAPICVPLSGGLDSRLILCKLHEMGYESIITYSYGPEGNFEAARAKQVANTLNVKWVPVYSNRKTSKAFFNSKVRKEYWDFADGLCSVPIISHLEALLTIKKERLLPENGIHINGQSGDFITGGHISSYLMSEDCNSDQLADHIADRHYALWNMSECEKSKFVHQITDSLSVISDGQVCSAAALYEAWEYQERQCKYVINGQRLYDYLGMPWLLPLWDLEFVNFWQTVPFEDKRGQSLYKQWLERWNYKGLFYNVPSENRRRSEGVQNIYSKVGSLTPDKIKAMGRKYGAYWGHYQNLYQMFGVHEYLSHIGYATVPPVARGVVAMAVQRWIRENFNLSMISLIEG